MKKVFIPLVMLLFFALGISFTIKESSAVKKVMKQLKNNFGYVPSGEINLNNKNLSVQAFFMSKSEVTNGEYKVFLKSLKDHGEDEKYAIANVDTLGWNTVLHNDFRHFSKEYFQNTAFKDYPVVNISKEGAQLYCQWLTRKMNESLPKEKQLKFRLPLKSEWLRAAEGTAPNKIYSWGNDYLRNSKGQYLANFVKVRESSISRDDEGNLTIVKNTATVPSKNRVDVDVIAPALSYYPNEFDLYNLNGNVAEMLSQSDEVIGGSWYDAGYDIRNRSTREYKGASPLIGFRVVATVLN